MSKYTQEFQSDNLKLLMKFFPEATYACTDNYKLDCVNPDCSSFKSGKMKLNVSISKGVFQCFVCGIRGTLMHLIQKAFKISYDDIERSKRVMDINAINRNLDILGDYFDNHLIFNKVPVIMPENALEIDWTTFKSKCKAGYEFLIKERGLNKKNLKKTRLFYTKKGNKEKKEPFFSIIFPVFRNKKLIYYQARSYKKKWFKNTTNKVSGFFNEEILKKTNTIYIVESPINALTMDEPAIALYGKVIKEKQLNYLERFKDSLKKIVVCLDTDLNKQKGKMEYNSKKIAKELRDAGFKNVHYVNFPPEQDINDLRHTYKEIIKDKIKKLKNRSSNE